MREVFTEEAKLQSRLDVETALAWAHAQLSTIPEGFILTDYILRQMTTILKNLEFDYGNIRRNLDLTLGLCLTERVMVELVWKGIGRQEAHELLRRLAMKCWSERRSLRDVMLEDPEASGIVMAEELDEWLKSENCLGTAVEQVDRAVASLRKRLS